MAVLCYALRTDQKQGWLEFQALPGSIIALSYSKTGDISYIRSKQSTVCSCICHIVYILYHSMPHRGSPHFHHTGTCACMHAKAMSLYQTGCLLYTSDAADE